MNKALDRSPPTDSPGSPPVVDVFIQAYTLAPGNFDAGQVVIFDAQLLHPVSAAPDGASVASKVAVLVHNGRPGSFDQGSFRHNIFLEGRGFSGNSCDAERGG